MSSDFDHYTNLNLNPIADHILVEDIESEDERVQNGIILLNERGENRGIRPRWARVYRVGPEQEEIKVGEWLLIEHGRWSRGVKIKSGKVVRKIDLDGLMMVSDKNPGDI